MRSESYKDKKFTVFFILQLTSALIITEIINRITAGSHNTGMLFLFSLGFYVVIYLMPIYIYLRFYNKVNVFSYLKLNSNVRSGIFKGIAIGAFIFIVLLIKNRFIINRQFQFPSDLFVITGRILVGPLEEIPFRGFYLQKIKEYTSFWKANLVTSLIFTLIHVPNFIPVSTVNIFPLFIIMVVSMWMGYIFYETKSLWCAAIVHSIYDLSIWIIL
jgi:membrane protease YdiL (CAAX protease family)